MSGCCDNVVLQEEAEADLHRWLRSVIWALSGDSPYGTWMEQLSSASGSLLLDTIPEPPSASLAVPWMSEADLDYMAEQFAHNGLFGPIAWYQNFGEWYEISEALDDPAHRQRFEMPAAFLYGGDSHIMRFDPNWEEEMPRYFDDMQMCTFSSSVYPSDRELPMNSLSGLAPKRCWRHLTLCYS